MYANKLGWTDCTPFEVIKQNTERKYTVRLMNTERDPNWTPECHVGGFCAHVSNNYEQKWIITSNPEGYTTEIRLNKKGEWKDKYGARYNISDHPVKFHDYNF